MTVEDGMRSVGNLQDVQPHGSEDMIDNDRLPQSIISLKLKKHQNDNWIPFCLSFDHLSLGFQHLMP